MVLLMVLLMVLFKGAKLLFKLLFKQLEILFKLKLLVAKVQTIKIPNSVEILEAEQGKDPRLGSRLTLSVWNSTTIFAA